MKIVRQILCMFLIFTLAMPTYAITLEQLKEVTKSIGNDIKDLNSRYKKLGNNEESDEETQQLLNQSIERYRQIRFEFTNLPLLHQDDANDLNNLLDRVDFARDAFSVIHHRLNLDMNENLHVFPVIPRSSIRIIVPNQQHININVNTGIDWWRWGFTVAIMVVGGYVSYNLYPIINGKKGEKSIWDIAKDVAKLIADVFEYCTGNKKQNHRRDDHDRDPDPGFFKRENNVYSRG